MSQVTNLSSLLNHSINRSQDEISRISSQLASGKKTLDPAQNGVVTRLSAQVSAYGMVDHNISTAQNIMSAGQTSLSQMADILTQMQDLAIQATSAGITPADQASLSTTYIALRNQFNDLSANTTLNESNPLTSTPSWLWIPGSTSSTITTGIDGTAASQTPFPDTGDHSFAFGWWDVAVGYDPMVINNSDISNAVNASNAVTWLSSIMVSVTNAQSAFSAASAGLSEQSKSSAALSAGLQNTINTIQSVDAPKLQADLQALNNTQSIGYYLVSQMNSAASAVLSIFR